MLNIEKYKNLVLKNLNCCQMESDLRKLGCKAHIDCAHTLCEDCKEHFFKWLLSEAEEPILDDVEREYLTAVIKPFRKKVNCFTKILNDDSKKCFIRIRVNNTEHVNLPYFNTASGMYAGMKPFRVYTLEELGL